MANDVKNKYYIVSRYPQYWPVAKEKQAKEAYNIAKDIIDFIKRDLNF